ncbi:PREDICTED: uncharacterized protein LOC106746677 [Dinoponera quadriceps]|uniref:Uncharacterized protein LOC106746677 n=1 Tax=Dinoponera quadriceps TaxID=609295 RepID=A0A6P3XKH0_DINQU|nr:PREDICTED: uncharacterized protein LOC106746677 [Dinoponera quadriceps]
MEYFVDPQRYFYLIMLHMNTAVCIGITVLAATGTLFIACQKFICGLFVIASYRIERAMRIDTMRDVNLSGKNLIYDRIIKAVEIHRKAMKLSKFLMSKFEVPFGLLIMAGVVSLSLNLFRILSSEFNIEELSLPTAFALMITLYMFLANYVGQNLTDHNSQIFATVYSIQWYKAPLHVQKLILFLLQKGTKDFTLNVGSLLNGSMKSFATLTNTSISYFTVLYSTQR